MATHSSILAREMPWTGKPGRLAGYSLWDCKELDTTGHTLTHTYNLVLYCRYSSISLFFRSMFFKNDCIIFLL